MEIILDIIFVYFDFLHNFVYKSENLFLFIQKLLVEHSFLSSNYSLFYYGALEKKDIFFLLLLAILVSIFIDVIQYYFGNYISRLLKYNYTKKNFFYIYGRFIPIFGIFSVLVGSILTKDFSLKDDIKKIFLGNLIFIVVSLLFWFVVYVIEGPIG